MMGARKISDISDRKPPGRFLWSLPRRFDLYEIYVVYSHLDNGRKSAIAAMLVQNVG